MRLVALTLLATLTSAVVGRSPNNPHDSEHVLGGALDDSERHVIELNPGETRLVTEEQKWELKRLGVKFMDITLHPDLGSSRRNAVMKNNEYPEKPVFMDRLKSIIPKLSKDEMRSHLEVFTSFHTRYYKSSYGKQSSEWLLETIQNMIKDAGADKYGVYAEHFEHPWGQNSIITTIPGKSNKTIVIGAHQDSINIFLPFILGAPGADDDGSGTVTILEALRVLLTSEDIVKGNAENTIEFHWYSAEEGGLLGSQAIFSRYEASGRDVGAMLQQDMTGFVQMTLDAGERESMAVVTDFVDAKLTNFIKKIIGEYCDIPYVESQCGYACSDHASATKAGFPSAFVMESEFKYTNSHVHTTDDTIQYLSFDHMLQHAKLTVAFTYELAFTTL